MNMKSAEGLRELLLHLDGRGYKAYKRIQGRYDFGHCTLMIDHVQGDPFAAPTSCRVFISHTVAAFPDDTWNVPERIVAFRDFIAREFYRASSRFSAPGKKGSGKSGLISIEKQGQEILERSSVVVDDDGIEVRFVTGLPAFGRRIAGRKAAGMLCDDIPQIATAALKYENISTDALYCHLHTAEDADRLRELTISAGLVSFIADGSLLPRESGISQRPLSRDRAIFYSSPASCRRTFLLPHAGEVSGMGIDRGVTLIVGGGYHGKSTVLNAMELGIYNHIPGDGRELVVTDPGAVKIRAEDGRRIEKVSISPFITNLPMGKETDAFSSEDASGSTSQAANIMENLEIGAQALFIDEDTSATNFMIRDSRMQELIEKGSEPITPFIDKARQLFTDCGVSTVLVVGGSGDYFSIADRVIAMKDYLPRDVTEEARRIAKESGDTRRPEGGDSFGSCIPRRPVADSIRTRKGKRPVKTQVPARSEIRIGYETIDLSQVEQIVDRAQTRTIAAMLVYMKRELCDGTRSLSEMLSELFRRIERDGLDLLAVYEPDGSFAMVRPFETAAALNRLRTLIMRNEKK